jgi:aureolysin
MKIRFSSVVLSALLALSASAASATDILIYDANFNPLVPLTGKGGLVMQNGKRTGRGLILLPSAAKSANNTLRTVLDFYQNNFNRNSYDNQGSRVEAIVNMGSLKSLDFLGTRQNAAWVGQSLKLFLFGKGGDELGDFTQAVDVVAHEFTHAVIETTSKLEYNGQSGALNESFADIMGETAQLTTVGARPGTEFQIGESVISDSLRARYQEKTGRTIIGLRDMRRPEGGLEVQPGHMSQIPAELQFCIPSTSNDRCGVHILSGIPNKAAAQMMSILGPQRTKNLFYKVMTERLVSNSQFVDFARELRRECAQTMSRAECDVVDQSLRNVGL